jgi:hypothetical protein
MRSSRRAQPGVLAVAADPEHHVVAALGDLEQPPRLSGGELQVRVELSGPWL